MSDKYRQSVDDTDRSEIEIGEWTFWLEFERAPDVTVHIGTMAFAVLVGYLLGRRSVDTDTDQGDEQ